MRQGHSQIEENQQEGHGDNLVQRLGGAEFVLLAELLPHKALKEVARGVLLIVNLLEMTHNQELNAHG